MVTVIDATAQHCIELAPNLREMDQIECNAVSPGISNEEVLKRCALEATRSYAVVDSEDGCLAIFGVREIGAGFAIPWMLASDLFFTKYKRRFIREAPDFVQKLLGNNYFLYNYISRDNHVCIRWLSSLGFQVNTSQEVDVNGVIFHPFFYRKPENV